MISHEARCLARGVSGWRWHARIDAGQIDPSFVNTHTVRLEDGPGMYQTLRDKKGGCIKVVRKP